MMTDQRAAVEDFAARLKKCWWLLPKETQEEIVKILTDNNNNNNKAASTFGPGSDAYAAMLHIVNHSAANEEMMKRVYAVLNTSYMLKISQKRSITLAHFIQNVSFLLPSQVDLLAGIVAEMCPQIERYSQPAARVIGSAFAHGADLEAFQFFSDMLEETLRVNKKITCFFYFIFFTPTCAWRSTCRAAGQFVSQKRSRPPCPRSIDREARALPLGL